MRSGRAFVTQTETHTTGTHTTQTHAQRPTIPPQVLGYGSKSWLQPQLAFLRSLGVAQEDLPALVMARPQVLGSQILLVGAGTRVPGAGRDAAAAAAPRPRRRRVRARAARRLADLRAATPRQPPRRPPRHAACQPRGPALTQVTRWLTRYVKVPRHKVGAVLHVYPYDYSAAFAQGVRKWVASEAARLAEPPPSQDEDGEEGGP
jgi:hypothetical protein